MSTVCNFSLAISNAHFGECAIEKERVREVEEGEREREIVCLHVKSVDRGCCEYKGRNRRLVYTKVLPSPSLLD